MPLVVPSRFAVPDMVKSSLMVMPLTVALKEPEAVIYELVALVTSIVPFDTVSTALLGQLEKVLLAVPVYLSPTARPFTTVVRVFSK